MSTRAGLPRADRPAAGSARRAPAHAPRHAPRVPFALLVVGLVVGGLALLLALNTASAANELRRHNLADRDASLAAELEEVRTQVAASSAPGALASAAAALGLVPAVNPAFLQVGADGRVRVLGSPSPAAPVFVPPPPPATPRSTTKPPTPAHKTTPVPKPTGRTSSGARRPASAPTSATKPSPPRPTVTPTPTTTLPGGPR